MKTYIILLDKNSDVFALRVGFSYWGLVFQWLYLLYRGLFLRSFILLTLYGLLGNLIYGGPSEPNIFLDGIVGFIPLMQHPPFIQDELLRIVLGITRTIIFGLYIGWNVNKWIILKLFRYGYLFVDRLQAKNREEAINLYHGRFDSQIASQKITINFENREICKDDRKN